MVKRYVVWSPRVPTCMSWDSQSKAEQFAEFWRTTALLGCFDWRVSPIDHGANNMASEADVVGHRVSSPSARSGAANDALVTAREELAELLASKDALIAELQRKLNDSTLSAVREAAAQGKRIAELEEQVAMLKRSRVRTR